MIIDSSALIAILFDEPESAEMIAAIMDTSRRYVAAPTLVEATAVLLSRVGPAGSVALDALLRRMSIEVIPMSPEAADAARSGFARFGKGVGSPPVLNYGDCLSYGVAISMGEPLLFKGRDFTRTDVEVVL